MVVLTEPAPFGHTTRGWIPGKHRGIDRGWYRLDPVRSRRIISAAPGTVISVYRGGQYNDGWGNRVVIEHDGGYRTTYNHFAWIADDVKSGTTLPRGHYLGQMGNTGLSGGDHLHFELYRNGDRVDPAPYFGTPAVTKPASTPAPVIIPTVQEDDMLLITIKSTKAQIVLTPGRIFHCRTVKDMELVQYGIQKMTGRRPDFLPVDDADLLTYLAQYGVTGILKDTGKGLVIDAAKMPRPGGNFTQALDGAWRAETAAGVKAGKK